MTKELSALEKDMEKTKKQFLVAAKRATTEFDRQRKRLKKELGRVNARAKNARVQLQKKSERLVSTTATKAKRELRKQISGLDKLLDGARNDAAQLRSDLAPVMDDLKSARDHLAYALGIDKALAKVQRELSKKASVKKKVTKKAVTKKKPVTKKAAKKPATRKKAAKKATAKKKSAKKPATRKKASDSKK